MKDNSSVPQKITTLSITHLSNTPLNNRIGVAKGVFKVPSDFTLWDEEIQSMFNDDLLSKS